MKMGRDQKTILLCFEPHPDPPLKNKGRDKSMVMSHISPLPLKIREWAGGWVQ
jgi:hypothetical protein